MSRSSMQNVQARSGRHCRERERTAQGDCGPKPPRRGTNGIGARPKRHLESRGLVCEECRRPDAYRTQTTRLANSTDDIATTTTSRVLELAHGRVNHRCGLRVNDATL
jgi:hypothetical protein